MMKFIVRYCLFFTVCLLYSHCKKWTAKKETISGTLWDYCRKEPLAGFKVRLYEYSGVISSLQTDKKLISEVVTDNNGYFNFGEHLLYTKKRYSYVAEAVYSPDDELDLGHGYEYAQVPNGRRWNIQVGKNNYDTIRLCSQNATTGIIKIQNYSTIPPGDSLKLTYTYNYVSGQKLSTTLTYSPISNCFNASGEQYLTFPFKDCVKWPVKIEKYKSGVLYTSYDTIPVNWKTPPFLYIFTW